MSLTTEQLMQPRWEVIADYPGSVLNVGYVFTNANAWQESGFDPDKYPGIFKTLEWWRGRFIEELPLYLKTHGGVVFETKYKFSMRSNKLKFANPYGEWSPSSTLTNLLPATEEEYNAYQAQKKQP